MAEGAGQPARAPPGRLMWRCTECSPQRSICVEIRAESRCLCGHRLREHNRSGDSMQCGAVGPDKSKCRCPSFDYVFAQGAFILRCRCKHRHTDHDPLTKACARPGCACAAFDSPFVCNCDHGWAAHRQEAAPAGPGAPAAAAALGGEVNRWDLLQRGDGT